MLFEPIYIPRALNTGTCIKQGDLLYSVVVVVVVVVEVVVVVAAVVVVR